MQRAGGVKTLQKPAFGAKSTLGAFGTGVLLCWRSLGLSIAAMTENQWIAATVSVAAVLIAVFVAWRRSHVAEVTRLLLSPRPCMLTGTTPLFPNKAEFLLTTGVALG